MRIALPPDRTSHRLDDLHLHVVRHFVEQKEAGDGVEFPWLRIHRIAAGDVNLRQTCELLPGQRDLQRRNIADIETAIPPDPLGKLTGEAAIDRRRLKDTIPRLHRGQHIADQALCIAPENGLNHDLPIQEPVSQGVR